MSVTAPPKLLSGAGQRVKQPLRCFAVAGLTTLATGCSLFESGFWFNGDAGPGSDAAAEGSGGATDASTDERAHPSDGAAPDTTTDARPSADGGLEGGSSGPLAPLPSYVGIGLQLPSQPAFFSTLTDSGVPFDYVYQWFGSSNKVQSFVQETRGAGYIPVITYDYSPLVLGGSALASALASSSTMSAFYADYTAMLQAIDAVSTTKATVVHFMPNFWGLVELLNNTPTSVYVSVKSSGFAGLGGFPDNAAGLAQAMVAMRKAMAPNVILAWHASFWATSDYNPAHGTGPTPSSGAGPLGVGLMSGHELASFYNALQARWDLMFYETADIDPGSYAVGCAQQSPYARAWWSDASFTDYKNYLSAVYQDTGLHGMLWQTTVGNTLYDTCDNTQHHFQDNKAEYFLQSGNRQHMIDYATAGLIGILFQSGDNYAGAAGCQAGSSSAAYATTVWNYSGQDPYNPSPIDGNALVSTVAADEGGFLFNAVKAYHGAPVPWR